MSNPVFDAIIKDLEIQFSDSQSSHYLPKMIKSYTSYDPFSSPDTLKFLLDDGVLENVSMSIFEIKITGISDTQISGELDIQDISPELSTAEGSAANNQVIVKGDYKCSFEDSKNFSGHLTATISSSNIKSKIKFEAPGAQIVATALYINFINTNTDNLSIAATIDKEEDKQWESVLNRCLNKDKHKKKLIEFVSSQLSSQKALDEFSNLLNKVIES